MIYQWRESASFSGDAQVVGDRLTELANGDGRVTPHVVVSDARRQSSPLHGYFEWNDAKAAKEYRIERARHLIAAVMVVRDEVSEPVRAFINIRTEDDQSYRSLDRVLSDQALRELMLAQALAELNSIKNRYAQLVELADVFNSINKIKIPRAKARRDVVAQVSAP